MWFLIFVWVTFFSYLEWLSLFVFAPHCRGMNTWRNGCIISTLFCGLLSRVGGLEELVDLWRKNKFTDSCQLYTGEISTDSRLEVLKYYGEWRPGKSRKQKRATKLAKHLGIPVQRGDEPELFFYGKESGVVGMKVVDLPQSKCMHSEATLQDGYDKVRLH